MLLPRRKSHEFHPKPPSLATLVDLLHLLEFILQAEYGSVGTSKPLRVSGLLNNYSSKSLEKHIWHTRVRALGLTILTKVKNPYFLFVWNRKSKAPVHMALSILLLSPNLDPSNLPFSLSPFSSLISWFFLLQRSKQTQVIFSHSNTSSLEGFRSFSLKCNRQNPTFCK